MSPPVTWRDLLFADEINTEVLFVSILWGERLHPVDTDVSSTLDGVRLEVIKGLATVDMKATDAKFSFFCQSESKGPSII